MNASSWRGTYLSIGTALPLAFSSWLTWKTGF